MNPEYKINTEEKPEDSAWGIIGKGVGDYNKEQVRDNNFQRLCYVLQDSEGKVVGGILGETYWDWIYCGFRRICAARVMDLSFWISLKLKLVKGEPKIPIWIPSVFKRLIFII